MKENSIWSTYINDSNINILNEDISCDVLVIGGGITGILCAYELSKKGKNVIVVEKDIVASGTTKDTTAFITAQHETLYQDLINDVGLNKAKEYLDLNLMAVEKYEELSKEYDFDFKKTTSTLYSTKSDDKILKEYNALKRLGYEATLIKSLPINIDIKLGITFRNQAIINPVKLVNELKKKLKVYENTCVTRLKGNIAYTSNLKKINFNQVIIATNYPINNIGGLYFMKTTQRRSYVTGIKNMYVNGTYCDIEPDGVYFRCYDNYLIIGGNDRDTRDICINKFYDKVKRIFPNEEIEYLWSGQDCITLDGIPYIGKLNCFHSNYYVATGFNLWGFTWAMVSSIILSNMIDGDSKLKLTQPNRCVINKQLFKNIKTSCKNLITFKQPRCTHLGCALHFNELEKVWECPCHGSRFNESGKVLKGPAKKDLE